MKKKSRCFLMSNFGISKFRLFQRTRLSVILTKLRQKLHPTKDTKMTKQFSKYEPLKQPKKLTRDKKMKKKVKWPPNDTLPPDTGENICKSDRKKRIINFVSFLLKENNIICFLLKRNLPRINKS